MKTNIIKIKITLKEMYNCMDDDSKDNLIDFIRENKKEAFKLFKRLEMKSHKIEPDYVDWINVFDKKIEYGIDLY